MGLTAFIYTTLKNLTPPSDGAGLARICQAFKKAGGDQEDFVSWCIRGGIDRGKAVRLWDDALGSDKPDPSELMALADIEAPADSAASLLKQSERDIPKTANAMNPLSDRMDLGEYLRYTSDCQDGALKPLAGMGISAETARLFRIGFNPAGGDIVVPVTVGRKIHHAEEIGIQGEALRWSTNPPNASPTVFNGSVLRDGSPVVMVTYSLLDALAVHEAGGCAVSAKSADVLLSDLMDQSLGGLTFSELRIVCPHGGEGEEGYQWADGFRERLVKAGFRARTAIYPEMYGSFGEWLVTDRKAMEGYISDIGKATERMKEECRDEYLRQTSQAGAVGAFLDGCREGIPVTPTGTLLDQYIKGLTEGLVILGGMSSTGKTTFALQICDSIASRGDRDILYISLEQRRGELMAKSLSRIINERKHIKITATQMRTDFGSLPREFKKIVEDAAMDYGDTIGRHLHVLEGRGNPMTVQDVRASVERHVLATGERPIVVLDYLQLLSGSRKKPDGSPEKMDMIEILDEAVMGLTAIARDYKTTVLAICAFNRAQGKGDAGLDALYGSSRIEYSADLILALQPCKEALKTQKDGVDGKFDYDAWKDSNPRPVEVKISKNRSGITGKRVNMNYAPDVDRFLPANP